MKQLVVIEADVTGIRANHHRVFLGQQLQLARPFLRQERTKTTAVRPEGLSLRGGGEKEKTGTDNIQRGFLPTHTHTHTHALCRRRIRAAIIARAHRQAAAAGRPLARPSHGGEPAEKSSILVQSSLKQQTTPQLPLPHGRSLKTNPAAQNNILRAFYRSRPAPLLSSKSVITDRTGAVFCGSKQTLPKRSPNVCNPPEWR